MLSNEIWAYIFSNFCSFQTQVIVGGVDKRFYDISRSNFSTNDMRSAWDSVRYMEGLIKLKYYHTAIMVIESNKKVYNKTKEVIYAIKNKNEEFALMLLALYDCKTEKAHPEWIREACMNGTPAIIKKILEFSGITNISPPEQEISDKKYAANIVGQSIYLALEKGHIEVADIMIKYFKFPVNMQQNRIFITMCFNGATKAVKYLLDSFPQVVDPSDCDNEALKNAIVRADLDIIMLLLNDKRVDTCYFHLILHLVERRKKDCSEIIRYLIRNVKKWDYTSPTGESQYDLLRHIIHQAVYNFYNNYANVSALLEFEPIKENKGVIRTGLSSVRLLSKVKPLGMESKVYQQVFKVEQLLEKHLDSIMKTRECNKKRKRV